MCICKKSARMCLKQRQGRKKKAKKVIWEGKKEEKKKRKKVEKSVRG